MKPIRIQIDLTDTEQERVDIVRRLAEIKAVTDVVRLAIRFTAFALTLVEDGAELVVKQKDGSSYPFPTELMR